MTWKKGKTFRRNGKTVRYIYKNGRKSTKKLVTVKTSKRKSAGKKSAGKKSAGKIRRKRY